MQRGRRITTRQGDKIGHKDEVFRKIFLKMFKKPVILIDYILFYVPLENITYRDVTITGEELQHLDQCSVLLPFEQGGGFIVPHLL